MPSNLIATESTGAARAEEQTKKLGTRCPRLLADTKHGAWTFAVDIPSLTDKRTTMRRSGFSTKTDAQTH
jgi:hypothetical protein